MGSLLSSAFIKPDELPGCVEVDGVLNCDFSNPDWGWGMIQVLSLMAAYGYILYNASNLLADGSELLLLVPHLAGIVGSVVLPILGAVPDGAIMLFSGLGDDSKAQENLSVGIGTLAGSTIMLLTIPWCGSVFCGAVPIDERTGLADYSHRRQQGGSLFTKGITPDATIGKNAYIMMATAMMYLVIQGPAFQFAREEDTPEIDKKVSQIEQWFALAGLIGSIIAFVSYLALMVMQSGHDVEEYLITAQAIKMIEAKGPVTLSGIIGPIIADGVSKATAAANEGSNYIDGSLLDNYGKEKLDRLLRPFFRQYDTDGDGKISTTELVPLLRQLGEKVKATEAQQWMQRLDPDGSGAIDADELVVAMLNYVREKVRDQAPASPMPTAPEVEDEEEEMPEDFKELSPEQQQVAIQRRSFAMMAFGTTLILIFSDPMVDVMSNVGQRLDIAPFYIAFVLAPLASNASELLASLAYASKKTKKTITVSLSSLEGAACMNNTFCLGIFMGLVFFKGLTWKFSAETVSILLVQLSVGFIATFKTQRLWHALVVLSLYPLSILFVALVEAAGFD